MTSGRISTITDEQIAAALAKHGNRRRAAAREIHCSPCKVTAYCDRMGIPEAPKPPKACSSYKPVIRWNAERVSLLRKLYVDDRLSVEDIAEEFGTTPIGIRTAMSCSGLSLDLFRKDAGRMQRKCLCCQIPFLSEGRHNRQCVVCFQENSRIAA